MPNNTTNTNTPKWQRRWLPYLLAFTSLSFGLGLSFNAQAQNIKQSNSNYDYIAGKKNANKCMAKQGWTNEWDNGRVIHIWDCNHPAQANLQWIYEPRTGYIRSKHNRNKCMAKQGWTNEWDNGRVIHIWDCNHPAQANLRWGFD